MSGFITRYARTTLLGVIFLVATLFFAGFAHTGHAAAAGIIKGGKYYFDVPINGTAQKFPISKETTTITLSPAATGAVVNLAPDAGVKDGFVEITNVPAGTYTVTMTFKLTKNSCAVGNFMERIAGNFTIAGAIICNTIKGDLFFNGSRVFTGIAVANGETKGLEADTTTEKRAGNAVRTDENGNVQLDCKGDFLTEWVLCPMVQNMFSAMDFILSNIIQPFLTVNPLTANDTDGNPTAMFRIWDNIRNVVNIGFILVFFVIIFSQVTSIGITNYGVKKLLPRLIGIAILTNLSFYLCAIMVDVSNILGAGVTSLLTSAILNGQPTIDFTGDYLLDHAVVGAVLAALPLAIIALPAVIIFFVVAFIIFAIAAICILLRQVILIFLIVISPLALLAAILPNTSRLASEWFSLFSRLLLMYPLIMMLFAIGKIASSVLTQVGGLGG